jgi:hypothetical protein
MERIVAGKTMEGIADVVGLNKFTTQHCAPCQLGKMRRRPHPPAQHKATKPGERVFSDICGPFRVVSFLRNRYFTVFVDQATGFVVAHFLKTRDGWWDKEKETIAKLQRQYNVVVKVVRTDNAREMLSGDVKAYHAQKGIRYETTVPHTPQQNGNAERMNLTILNQVRPMLLQSGVPHRFWDCAVATAVHNINNLPSKINNGIPPITAFTSNSKHPNIKQHHPFGCEVYVSDTTPNKDKLAPRGIRCVNLGPAAHQPGWRVWNISKRSIITAATDVVFNNDIFPFREPKQREEEDEEDTETIDWDAIQPRVEKDGEEEKEVKGQGEHGEERDEEEQTENRRYREMERDDDRREEVEPRRSIEREYGGYISKQQQQRREHAQLRRSDRSNKGVPPIRYGLSAYVDAPLDLLISTLTDTGLPPNPETYEEAVQGSEKEKWEEAMRRELNALKSTGTYELVTVDRKTTNVIGTKWVLRRKLNKDGSIERYKGRLVAKGFQQIPGVDCGETFAPTGNAASRRIVFAIAAAEKRKVRHLDVVSAFLNGTLEETIYVEQPPGYNDGTGRVWKLRRSLYGLRQAPRCWNSRFHQAMRKIGFQQCVMDPCVYTFQGRDSNILLYLHVDDIVVAYHDEQLFNSIIQQLTEEFMLKDLGPAQWLLGMEVVESESEGEHRIGLKQELYLNNILRDLGMAECNATNTPNESNLKPRRADPNNISSNIKYYQSMVGKLLYAANTTRPDISFITGVLCRYMSAPDNTHLGAAKRVLRYIRGTTNVGVRYSSGGDNPLRLYGYVDADNCNDPDTRKPVAGYVFFLAGGPVSWSSKQEETPVLSTMEGEYVAASLACSEALWMRQLLEELGYPQPATTIYVDNSAAINIANNTSNIHNRAKHIDLKYHMIKAAVYMKKIDFVKISTEDNIADLLTKPIPNWKFLKFKKALVTQV